MRSNAPLFSCLIEYAQKNKIPFHMPGHKQGRGILNRFKTDLFRIDVTELPDTDNLHFPEGAIAEAQKLMAEAFGALESFFLVNGSTCGIQAMIAAVCNPGDVLIVDRNCHSSVISALILCGVIPRYIYPEYIVETGFVGGIAPVNVKEAIDRYPEAKGVIITSPNYYGICSDVRAIADVVHSYDKLLLVDEAHGAHFYFHEKLPKGALQCGADLCVQSAHKTLPALTQSSVLHVGSDRVNVNRLKSCLRLFQSSSPSFILMAYLDAARCMMVENGRKIFNDLLEYAAEFTNNMNENTNGICPGKRLVGKNAVYDVDLSRLVVNFSDCAVSGYHVAEKLNQQYNIQVEMADWKNIICIPSSGNNHDDFQALEAAIYGILKSNQGIMPKNIVSKYPKAPYKIPPYEAFYSDSEVIDLRNSTGRIACDTIISFPPGVPVLCPGEAISTDIIEFISEIKNAGGKAVGLVNNEGIRVLKFV